MVQLANPGRRRPAPDPRPKAPAPVKLELEDPIEDEYSPVDKRSRISPPPNPWSAGAPFSLLEEPSPLGLRLRKSPSLLDLIQMRLSQAESVTASSVMSSDTADAAAKRDLKSTAASAATDKMKASNFPALLLRIGTWECVSRYEGDLVAKCYFAKHKLVWEVLDGGLKSKIEIQWSDISAVKATLPENGPGTLDIVLARQPLFFRETNPQPRKHTLWQATSDFTGGQASTQRRHFIQCAQGLLNKHFEKIIQCDPRLNALSRKPDINLDSPYFETRFPVFESQDESKCHVLDNTMDVCASGVSGFRDVGSPSVGPSVSTTSESTIGRTLETPSPNSVSAMDTKLVDESANKRTEESSSSRCWDQVKVPVLGGSMSMVDLVNHIGHCFSEQKALSNPFLSADGSPNKDMLEDLAQYLLGDSQMSSALVDSQILSASDEQSLMSRVNSLCCLLQKDPATFQSLRIEGGDDAPRNGFLDEKPVSPMIACERKPMFDLSTSERRPLFDLSAADEYSDASSYKQPPPSISRKESFGDLLMHLPRIASQPQVLFKITEDPENQAR